MGLLKGYICRGVYGKLLDRLIDAAKRKRLGCKDNEKQEFVRGINPWF